MNQDNPQTVLYMALELSDKTWRLAFSDTVRQRQVSVPAGDLPGLQRMVAQARQRWNLPPSTAVISCYEAGRDGFWLHRWLAQQGWSNRVIDPGSLEVNRRARRTKTDRLDATQLLTRLIRAEQEGTQTGWRVVRVPSVAEEDQRRWHRERERLLKEATAHRNRLKSLLVLFGLRVKAPERCRFEQLRDWQGAALPPGVASELHHQQQRLALVRQQLRELEEQLRQRLAQETGPAVHLLQLRAVGPISAVVLDREFFGWRQLTNPRQVGSLAGLTGTPYNSGNSARDQGISKAGNRRVRVVMVELAWAWLRWQPASDLTEWFWRRFGSGSGRQRRVGIVALARRLLVALWRYLQTGQVPAGARLKSA